MKNILIVVIVFAAGVSFLSMPVLVAAQEGYAWVLVDQIDFTGSEDVAQQSRSTLYDASVSYNPGDYSITKTYTGDFTPGIENLPEKGETATAFARFENVPDIIYPDSPVKIDFSLGFSDRRIINFRQGGGETSASAFFCPPENTLKGGNGGLPDFYDNDRTTWFKSGEENGFATIEKELVGEIGAGEKGKRVGLCVRQSFGGISLETIYVYEWKAPKAVYNGISSLTDKKYDVPKDENGDYIDSGVRINDVGGEVLIRHGDDPIGWEMVWPDTVIYEGDLIYVKDGDSACSLSLSDMTTFDMGPQSSITVNMQQEDSQIKILAGKIMANIKKMVTTGSMSVEMSQAVAGIKGTIFVCETDDETSSVKVLEGSVEVTANNGGMETIGAGQMVSASGGSLGAVEEFSVAQELDNWSEDTSGRIKAEIEERIGVNVGSIEAGDNTKKTPILVYSVLVLLLLTGGFVFLKLKQAKSK